MAKNVVFKNVSEKEFQWLIDTLIEGHLFGNEAKNLYAKMKVKESKKKVKNKFRNFNKK